MKYEVIVCLSDSTRWNRFIYFCTLVECAETGTMEHFLAYGIGEYPNPINVNYGLKMG